MFNDLIYKKDSESNSEGFADPRCLMFAAEHAHKIKQQNIMCNNDYCDTFPAAICAAHQSLGDSLML